MITFVNSASILHDGFFIKQKEFYVKVYFKDIVWIEADRSYCYIHTTDKVSTIVTYPLGDVKRLLPSQIFIQIHRSYIVNINYVDKFTGNMIYVMEKALSISQKYKEGIISRFLKLERQK